MLAPPPDGADAFGLKKCWLKPEIAFNVFEWMPRNRSERGCRAFADDFAPLYPVWGYGGL